MAQGGGDSEGIAGERRPSKVCSEDAWRRSRSDDGGVAAAALGCSAQRSGRTQELQLPPRGSNVEAARRSSSIASTLLAVASQGSSLGVGVHASAPAPIGMPSVRLSMLLSTLVLGASGDSGFPGAAQFERWSHFKYVGLPAVGADPLGRAAIADATCRMLSTNFAGYKFWRSPKRADAVVDALESVPLDATGALAWPSNFTLSAARALAGPCYADDGNFDESTIGNFSTAALSGAVQNWYHALCAPAFDASWHGRFDPAVQVQQEAATSGLLCIATCDLAARPLPGTRMAALMTNPDDARDAVCAAFPWDATHSPTRFVTTSRAALARATEPLTRLPCGCAAGGLNGNWPAYSAVTVAFAALLVGVAAHSCRVSRRPYPGTNGPRNMSNNLLHGGAGTVASDAPEGGDAPGHGTAAMPPVGGGLEER